MIRVLQLERIENSDLQALVNRRVMEIPNEMQMEMWRVKFGRK